MFSRYYAQAGLLTEPDVGTVRRPATAREGKKLRFQYGR